MSGSERGTTERRPATHRALGLLVLGCLLTMSPGPAAAQIGGGATAGSGTGTGSVTGDVAPTTEAQRPGGAPGLTEEYAQSVRPYGSLSLPGPVDPAVYRVGPGDILQLLLWGRVSRTVPLEVGPEGHILLPSAGTIAVSGRTLAEVKSEVLDRMSREFRGVKMDLRLLRPRTFRIYVTGQVRAPGPLDASAVHRVADVVGTDRLLENGSRRRVELMHGDGTREFADLDRFHRTGHTGDNPYLRDGDVINVPVATDWVYAEGAFARPGRIELGLRDSLLTLFRLAGDPLPSADAQRALLVRFNKPFQPESLWFGLDEVYSQRVAPEMREGDRVYVYFVPQYHQQHQVSIWGELARPGVYPINEGRTRLSDLVAGAGGFLGTADLSAIRVNRRNPNLRDQDPEFDRLLRLSRNDLTATEYEVLRTKLAGLREDFRVDWHRVLANKEQLDLLLRDGDMVRVEHLVSSIRVDGEVKRPGILAYRDGLTVSEYVKQAGGFTDRAWRGRVRVTRAVTGQTLLARNIGTLDPGDILWVPEKPDPNWLQSTQTLLLFTAQIATVILAIQANK